MRPLELTVKGFRSFAERAVIDWRGRRLVGIVGPIGSGKTSILDAIVFALYGKTPALGTESKTLIRHGSESARVELAFESGGEVWRVIRVIRTVGQGRHALYRGEDTLTSPVCEKEREVTARIEELLGLDFPTFCRSVLLAQNRFAEFLTASPGDRDRVLKGVFGFDRLDGMQALARERRAGAALAVKELEGRLATLDDDERRLEEARRALHGSAAQVERFEEVSDEVRDLARREAEARRRAEAARRSSADVEELVGQLPSDGEVEELIGAAEQAAADLEGLEEALREAGREAGEADRVCEATVAEVGSAEDHARAESRLDALARTMARLDRQAERRAELERTANDRRADLARAEAEAADARRAEDRARREAEGAAEALRRARDERSVAEKEAGDREALARAREEIQKLRLARADVDRDAESCRRVDERLRAAEEDLARAAAERDRAAEKEGAAEERLQLSLATVKRAETDLRHAEHAEMALTLAATLEAGKPCPVCDQTVRTVQAKLPSVIQGHAGNVLEEARAAEREAGSLLRELSRKAASWRNTVETVERTRKEALAERDEVTRKRARSEEAGREIEAGLAELLGAGDPEVRMLEAEERLARAEARLGTCEHEERKAAERLRDALHAVELARQQEEAARSAFAAVEKQLEDAASEIREAETSVREARTEVEELLGAGDPEELLERARSRLAEAQNRAAGARRAERDAAGRVEEARRRLESSRQAQERLVSRLAGLAGKLGHVDDAAAEALTPRQLADEVRKRLDDTRRVAAAAATEAVEEERKARHERGRIHVRLGLEPEADFDAARAAARAAWTRDSAVVSQLEERLARAAAIRGERHVAEARHALYVQLADDLTASKFLRYLLEQERSALADLGSERFELLSEGRYRFTHDGAFQVIDQHNANAARKADTLSGGETFLASLALALALAEKVTAGGGRLDAFFLDEGFGSLDAEHLALAMEGIERLVTDSPNRLVTVVSHVPEMRERIEDLIELDKDPLTGSTILKQGARRTL
jgi:exonuclease SbcC